MSKYRMTVDPGLGGTGIALWETDSWKKLVPPCHTEVIHATREYNWIVRSGIISTHFQQLLFFYKPDTVWIEFPGLHTTASGMASAARGDVFKLTFVVGRLAECCLRANCDFKPLEVNDWKGTMSKEAVAKRVANRFNVSPEAYGNHAMDAVGMGLYLKGGLNQTGITRRKL